jgi:hypothetical protein
MRTQYHLALVGTVAFSSLLSATALAESLTEIPVSLELDYARPVDSSGDQSGFGGAVRFGPQLDLKLMRLTAELGLGAHAFPGSLGPVIYRGVLGTRFGFGLLLRPSIYGHLGVGHADWFQTGDITHLTADVGLALDLTLVPHLVEVGAHGDYNVLFSDGSVPYFRYVALGAHVTFIIGGHGK